MAHILVPRLGVSICKFIEDFHPWYDSENFHTITNILEQDRADLLRYRFCVQGDIDLADREDIIEEAICLKAFNCFLWVVKYKQPVFGSMKEIGRYLEFAMMQDSEIISIYIARCIEFCGYLYIFMEDFNHHWMMHNASSISTSVFNTYVRLCVSSGVLRHFIEYIHVLDEEYFDIAVSKVGSVEHRYLWRLVDCRRPLQQKNFRRIVRNHYD